MTRKKTFIFSVPPMTARDKKQIAETYGMPARNVRSITDLLPRWLRSGQRVLNGLAKQDRIKPPKLDISNNAGIWINSNFHPGYYRARGAGRKPLIALDTTLVALGMIEADKAKCPTHLWVLMHEYQHHRQSVLMGEEKVTKTYKDEGSVDWKHHKLEREADDFANSQCSRGGWKWDD